MGYAFAFGVGVPGLQVGVELLDTVGGELDDLGKGHRWIRLGFERLLPPAVRSRSR
jgi:hypothetical protein